MNRFEFTRAVLVGAAVGVLFSVVLVVSGAV